MEKLKLLSFITKYFQGFGFIMMDTQVKEAM